VLVHPVPPYALAWPSNHISVAGCDKKIVFYTPGKENIPKQTLFLFMG
jgi:hypothetical protein